MYRDDESAARVRRDQLAAELSAAKAALAPDRAALDDRQARARTKKLGWTLPPIVVAVVLAGWFVMNLVREHTILARIPKAPIVRPARDLDRCRLADGEACARLAAAATTPKHAFELYRWACVAGSDRACLWVADAFEQGVVTNRNPSFAETLRRQFQKE